MVAGYGNGTGAMNRTGYLGDLLGQLVERRFAPLRGNSGKPVAEMCANLLAGAGEVSTMRLAREILGAYARMDDGSWCCRLGTGI